MSTARRRFPAAYGRPLLLVAASLLAACAGETPATPPVPVHEPLETVMAGVGRADAEVSFEGVVEAVEQAALSSQTTGRVVETPVDVGDAVDAGQLLLRLRAAEQVAGLGQARAALAAARARDAEAGAQFERIREMYERRVVARATYDTAATARDAARAELAAAEAALESAREGVGYTELRAPFDGRVLARPAQVGEAVAPGSPLLTVASLAGLRVAVDVPQGQVAAVRASREAQVTLGAQRIAATRVSVFPSADPQTGTFRARVDLPPDSAGFAPGLRVRVAFMTDDAGERLLVPRSALVERSELRALYVVADDGHVGLRQVRLGRAHGDQVEVLAGLERGERVATDPAAATRVLRETARD